MVKHAFACVLGQLPFGGDKTVAFGFVKVDDIYTIRAVDGYAPTARYKAYYFVARYRATTFRKSYIYVAYAFDGYAAALLTVLSSDISLIKRKLPGLVQQLV